MDLATFLIQCLNAVQYGLLLFLVASGLTLIFGIMGVINLAHGSFYMIGAYMAYALAPWVGATIGGGFFTTLALGSAAVDRVRLSARVEFLQLPVRARTSAAGADDVRADPGVRGVAQHPRWRRRARRGSTCLAVGQRAARRCDDLPDLSLVHLGGVHRRRARAVLRARAHAARHDDPRRREQSRDGSGDGRQHQVSVSRRVCMRASRWRCWPG